MWTMIKYVRCSFVLKFNRSWDVLFTIYMNAFGGGLFL